MRRFVDEAHEGREEEREQSLRQFAQQAAEASAAAADAQAADAALAEAEATRLRRSLSASEEAKRDLGRRLDETLALLRRYVVLFALSCLP